MMRPAGNSRNTFRRGVALIYVAVLMAVLIGLCSLAVDLGRVQVVKIELRRAADAAARYGAMGLPNGSSAAIANAISSAADNTADGSTVVITSSDVLVGNWDTTKTPNFSTARTPLNAVQVTCSRTAAKGNATSLLFGQVLGKRTCDVNAVSVAALKTTASSMTLPVMGSQNPWLAGMPTGTIANNPNPHSDPDTAALMNSGSINSAIQSMVTGSSGSYTVAGSGVTWNTTSAPTTSTISHYASWYPASTSSPSPMPAIGLPLSAGSALTFDNVSGAANYNYSTPTGTADGDSSYITDNLLGSEHGIADITAPIDSLIGIFLDDTQPDSTTAPAALDFSTDTSRDFSTLKPLLKQPFFIGDGRNSAGNPQQFVVPSGATRLFLGTMDSYEWSNNLGSFSISVHNTSTVSTVQ